MATKVPEIAALGLTDSRAHMRDRNLFALKERGMPQRSAAR
jgi:hypothetical protein